LDPVGFSLRHAEAPIEQIGHVRNDLYGSASSLPELEISKAGRSETLDFRRSIGDGGERVAEKSAGGIFQCQSGSSLSVST
jgi:hypothetical protein